MAWGVPGDDHRAVLDEGLEAGEGVYFAVVPAVGEDGGWAGWGIAVDLTGGVGCAGVGDGGVAEGSWGEAVAGVVEFAWIAGEAPRDGPAGASARWVGQGPGDGGDAQGVDEQEPEQEELGEAKQVDRGEGQRAEHAASVAWGRCVCV